jgi:hypothetical protein
LKPRRYRTAPPVWLRLARKLLPRWVWSGAGTVTGRIYKPAGFATGAKVLVGRVMTGHVSGVVPERWVLVVSDDSGKEHYVNVAPDIWQRHEVGSVITPDRPLVNHE